MAVPTQPDGYASVTPYLIVRDAPAALAFYESVLGAVERLRLDSGGGVSHAELQIGDSVVMLASEFPDFDALAPETVGGTPVSLLLYVDDVDAVVARAADRGATVLRPAENQFYGDRTATILDPFGHKWTLATNVEDVSEREMDRRWKQRMDLAGS